MRARNIAAGVLLLCAPRVVAQAPAFSTPLTTARGPFTRVLGVAELPDGRLVVVDGGEQRVRLVDFARDTSWQIGRTGRGPKEYLRPFGPLWLPGDSLAVYDAGNRRLLRIDPHGRPAEILSIPALIYAGHGVSVPKGADAEGYLYFERSSHEGIEHLPVIGNIVRWRPGTTAIDSMASLVIRDPKGRKVLAPFIARDGWVVGKSGLAVVRAAPYRTEWHRPGAPPVVGAPVALEPLPLTDAEVDAYWNTTGTHATGNLRIQGGAGAASRNGGAERARWDYPDVLPPFDATGGVRVDPSGDVWVVRHGRWNDTIQVVDVFDDRGTHLRSVRLPPHRKLVGFGEGVVYLVRVDENDLQWLERYQRPD
jgi:hypothetical protein